MKKENIDKVTHGNPTKKHLKDMQRDTPLITISADAIRIPAPPANSSDITRSELMGIKTAVDNVTDGERQFIDISDPHLLELFKSTAIQNNLSFDECYFKRLLYQIRTLTLALKYRYNRPRPQQISKFYGIDIAKNNSETTQTPSYPSGHAIQSHVIANVLSLMYPEYEKLFKNLADRISLSRIQMGSHYYSDIKIGEEIANMIDSSILTPYEDPRREKTLRTITRNFLSESYKTGEPEKLRVLDFDDTIAMTVEKVRIETPAGPKFISSHEFATYEPERGEYINQDLAFKEFDRVDIKRAKPVPFISDLLKAFASGDSMILVLTARSQAVEQFVIKFLEKRLGIQDAKNRVVVRGVSSQLPEKKVEVIKNYIEEIPSINFVSFYDDSGRNVVAVKNFLKDLGKKGDVRQVVLDKDGEAYLVNPEDSEERYDLREMTRTFLSMR